MADKNDLTTTQVNVLNFLKSFVGERGYPPTLREIASHFGLKGPRAPQKTITILEKKGYLRRTPGGSRTIEILEPRVGRPRDPSSGKTGRRITDDSDHGRVILQTIAVPIIGRVRAGEPVLALENIEGYLHLDRTFVSSKNVFLLRVQGDSMIEAHIQDGDFALVKPQPTAENGEIVVALIEDEATIKKIFQKRDLVRLEPSNPTMEPIVVQKGEKKVTIVGKVIGIFRKL